MTSLTTHSYPTLLSLPTLPLSTEDDLDTQRGRKRRRSSASNHVTSHRSTIGTLRGRARFRTPSASGFSLSLSSPAGTPDSAKRGVMGGGVREEVKGKGHGKGIRLDGRVAKSDPVLGPDSNLNRKLGLGSKSIQRGKKEEEEEEDRSKPSQSQDQDQDPGSEDDEGVKQMDDEDEDAPTAKDPRRKQRRPQSTRTRMRVRSLGLRGQNTDAVVKESAVKG
ncbi:hypothetical protein WAI453_009215 [Rhynchosporium graminicola]|uniref:Uncharacterized protein n=1 Tax=Rhynchosporium graminicola TaxID=2792576 RepID=A0A1E1KUJ5_9HELO|nr:uncharacterized protein RCO7_03054 [Rhynchosporium commune]